MLAIPPELIERLRTARHVAVLTGAGISAESGIPTFRDAQTGLWARYDPVDLATPEAFRRNPRLVWEWYAHRRALIEAAAPNPAHLALAELERRIEHFTLITQNVDGLHQRAGSRNVLELHGNLTRTRCASESIRIDSWTQTDDVPPRCPHCGAYLRPDVVWFGELLPEETLEQAIHAAIRCELFLSIGTSGIVEPAAGLPFLALRNGAYVAELNLTPSVVRDSFNAHIYGPAGMTLPELVRTLDA